MLCYLFFALLGRVSCSYALLLGTFERLPSPPPRKKTSSREPLDTKVCQFLFCCSPPSVFHTVMGMELQLRQSNFGTDSTQYAELKKGTTYETAKWIVGAYCVTRQGQEREWLVKIPDLKAVKDSSVIYSPSLTCVDEGQQKSQDYMLDPTNPVLCLSDVVNSQYWYYRQNELECQHGGPGSTVNFWRIVSP